MSTEDRTIVGRRLPLLLVEQVENDQERNAVAALTVLACSHLGWLVNGEASALPADQVDAKMNASIDAYLERARMLIELGISDALDIVQTVVESREQQKDAPPPAA